MEIDRLEELRVAIESGGESYELYVERGKEHYRRNNFGHALNDFNRALDILPSADEPKEFVAIINTILEFRHIDLLNP